MNCFLFLIVNSLIFAGLYDAWLTSAWKEAGAPYKDRVGRVIDNSLRLSIAQDTFQFLLVANIILVVGFIYNK